MKSNTLLFGAVLLAKSVTARAPTEHLVPLFAPVTDDASSPTMPMPMPMAIHKDYILEGANTKRSDRGKECQGKDADALKVAYGQCAERAKAGAEAAEKNQHADIINEIFRCGTGANDTDGKNAAARKQVAAILREVEKECQEGHDHGHGKTPITCRGDCMALPDGRLSAAVTWISSANANGTNQIQLCAPGLTETDGSCGGQDLGDVLLHEMTHSWRRTDDKGYGVAMIEHLSMEDSLDNADSYARFARAIKKNCTTETIK